MAKKIKFTFLLILLLTLNACTVYGFGDDYKKLPELYKDRVKPLESFDNLQTRYIYRISGKQLSEELQKHEKSLVYIFTNGSEKRPQPLKKYYDFAVKNNYKLFLVMDGFMFIRDTLEEISELHTNIFVIDKEAYNQNFKPNYVSLFEKDLDIKKNDKNWTCFNCLLYFEKGKFVDFIREQDVY